MKYKKGAYVIVPTNTDLNRGDQALVWESVNLINKATNSKNNFSLLEAYGSIDDIKRQSKQTKELGYNILPHILLHPGRRGTHKNDEVSYSKRTLVTWGIQAAVDLVFSSLLLSRFSFIRKIGFLKMSPKQLNTYKTIKEANAIIVKGGGFLHAYGKITDPYFIYYGLFYIFLANSLKKDVYIFPNSFGPFKGKLVKILMKNALRKCKFISAREKKSQQTLLKILNIESYLYPDLGFFLKSSEKCFKSYLINKGVPLEKKKCITITVRPYRFPACKEPIKKYNNYLRAIKTTIEHLTQKHNYHIVLVAHTLGPSKHEDDSIAIKSLLGILTNEAKKNTTYLYDENLTCQDIQKIYSYSDGLIGTRFHSVIFAMNSFVPVIAIAYGGNKAIGIMKDSGLANYVLKIENISEERLLQTTHQMLGNKDSIIKKMKAHRASLEDAKKSMIVNISKNL